ncbi:hypothetical protein SELMODRAFT_106159 [Selaginella moellendorffii]|uniref:Transcription initiation factor TFIID subunit 13 n=1 Tax=Selaginella moellendorffii TaxID=88036 RepID=D8S0J0_SELML|nr:transcription initiation factor TFIID subunit 13 [Selaginella moellendorffii]XP_002980557.1 transcription initiation factor TFIID subunit 13 [Selaginella moellendorffii]EFJ18208.1 hypothetical protein SELMODRAFT_112855 [Selaginella moellendorffii]EFJ21937.1 hypothetical protein SELMODRAFT_106159 [Selaginella moellendorffii]|eukprot:XP_002976827.1 transcription initiation factor TFIID subunit 13 [Selaginella moellendorffii]
MAGRGGKAQEGGKRKRGMFSKELRLMMYGFGDDICPLQESVALMEDMMIEYITDMVHKAQEVSSKRGKLTTEDVMFLVRKDIRKYARVKELLSMNEELKRARKVLNEDLDEQKLAALETQ